MQGIPLWILILEPWCIKCKIDMNFIELNILLNKTSANAML